MDDYAGIWEKFKAGGTLEFGGYMDPKWRNNYRLSASFMVPVDVSRFRERLAPLREALNGFPFVSLHPEHFMHITLLLAGFPVEHPSSEKEVSHEWLQKVAGRLKPRLRSFPAFELKLANLNAFPGAAFVEIHEGHMLEHLINEVQQSCGLKRPPGPPHLTLAYFQAPDGTPIPRELISAIEPYRDWPVGTVRVEKLELTLLKLDEVYPSPRPIAEFRLGTQAIEKPSG